MLNQRQIGRVLDTIGEMFPEAKCELHHHTPFDLAVAVILSAQCTDALVNKVTQSLFKKYRHPQDYLSVSQEELENDIRSIGLYRNKTKSIRKTSEMVLENYGGYLPEERDELIQIPGIGRKSANVITSVAFGHPAIAVDTHVERVTKRLGICRWKDSVREVEETLMKKVPKEAWSDTHHKLIFFGRYHCKAQSPQCSICPLLDICREGQKRMKKASLE